MTHVCGDFRYLVADTSGSTSACAEWVMNAMGSSTKLFANPSSSLHITYFMVLSVRIYSYAS